MRSLREILEVRGMRGIAKATDPKKSYTDMVKRE